MTTRNCLICNKEFTTDSWSIIRGYGKFCSLQCSGISKRGDLNRVCLVCHKRFRVRDRRHGRGQYCNNQCKSLHRTVECKCKQCDKVFRIGRSASKSGMGVFCSKHCYSEHMKTGEWRKCPGCKKLFWANRTKINLGFDNYCSRRCNHEHLKTGKYRNCIRCDKKFYISGWSVKQGHGKYCSKKCYDRGLTELSMKIRKLLYKWQKAVLIRDGYRCVDCGNKDDLEIHHIIPLVKIIEDYNINSLEDAKKCELLFDIDNGETLCEDCHIKITVKMMKRLST